MIESLLSTARNAIARRAYREAHSACLQVLQADPHQPEAYVLLGILTADHANHKKAVELFDRALAIDSSSAPARANKARSLIALNQREAALAEAESVSDLDTADGLTLDTLGVVFSRAGRHAAALPYYERALKKQPNQSNFHYNYGAALQFLGRLDEAREAYRRATNLNPNDARSHAAQVTITKQTHEDNDIDQLETLFPSFETDSLARLNIGHALAKAYEDLGDAENAIEWLHRAKALKKQELAYDPVFDRAMFDTARALTDLPIQKELTGSGPIFITGMPRTGTTLVDRIVSSHSQVTPAGELTDFGLLLKRRGGSHGPYVLDAPTLETARSADLLEIGRAYEARVRQTIGIETPVFTDKMPLNILYAPIILSAIPNARIICLLRHPADTVLSNYRQLFATGFSYYNYAYDLETTARYFAQFRRLVAAFESDLPDTRFMTVEYETVVNDIEEETRRILSFCGLPFEPACVEFHTNQAPVATASSVQVRQALYTSALARWKRYRPGIDPALRVLIEEGCLSSSDIEEQ